MPNSADKANIEKRDFFRLDQDVIFDVKVVDAFTAENGEAEQEHEDATAMSLLNELRKLDRDSSQTLRLLTEKNRLLGDYLKTLSSKIDLIARHTLFADDKQNQNQATKRINISEEGIAFSHDRTLYKDSYICVRLIFLPSYSPVLTFAKVLRCEQKKENYQIAAKFFRLTENDRQELSRQILKAQTRRRKKAQKPN